MLAEIYFDIEFVDPHALAEIKDDSLPMWTADQDEALGESIAQKNSAFAQILRERIPGLLAAKDWLDPDEYDDERLSQEAILRRYHRCQVLAAPWRGGQLVVRMFDAVIEVRIERLTLSRRDLPEFAQEFKTLLQLIQNTSGLQPWFAQDRQLLSAGAAVDRLIADRAYLLKKHFQSVWWNETKRKLAIPSLIVSALIAVTLSWLLAGHALEQGRRLAGVISDQTVTFITEQTLPPQYELGVFPKFALQGHIEAINQQVDLPVFRDEYIRAGLGAPYAVLPTHNPQTPYVLRREYQSNLPLIRLGDLALPAQGLFALLPIGVWYFVFAGPWLHALPHQREHRAPAITERLIKAVMVAIAMAVISWLKSR